MHVPHHQRGTGHPGLQGLAILLAGQICMAASVIFIKASTIPPGYLAADRLILAAILLFPFWLRERQRAAATPAASGTSPMAPATPQAWAARFRKIFLGSILPGILLGLHFITWNMGARATVAAHATMIVNLVPIAMPFFVFALTREKPGRWEILGTVVACAGLAVLGLARLDVSAGSLEGDGICFFSMLLVAAYFAFARRNSSGGLWSYVVPVYAVGGITAFLCSLPFFGNPFTLSYGLGDLVAILGLALGSTMVGHTTSNWAMRRYHPQVVPLFSVTQFIWAGLMAWLLYGEYPETAFYLSAAIVLSGCLITLRPWRSRKTAAPA